MAMQYNVIEVFTSEEARHNGVPAYKAILEYVRKQKIAARCIVSRGVAGCYENGEIATQGIEVLSFNMPLKIEIILPSPELESILPAIGAMVDDGIVMVEEMIVHRHHTSSRCIPRQLLVRDAMTPSPVSATRETLVSNILERLLKSDFNGMPVVDDSGRPIGMITQGDLIQRAGMPVRKGLLSDCAQGRMEELMSVLSRKTAAEIMSAPAITIQEDRLLVSAVDMMVAKGLKRFPVVDRGGRLVGMFARYDVFRTISRESPDWHKLRGSMQVDAVRTVSDIMHRDAQTVLPEATIEDVIRVIDTSDIQRVSVVDRNGRFLGLISDKAMLAAFGEHRGGVWQYLLSKLPFTEIGKHHREFIAHLQDRTAGDVMKTDVVVIQEQALIDEAIRIMFEKGIKRLPVVDSEGIFKGMVSRDDLLRLGVMNPRD